MRRPAFRRLAASYAVNELGDWMGIVALSVLVFDQTNSAFATMGLFLGTRFVPSLLGPLLVVRSERTSPRFSLPFIYCGEAACFAALAYLATNFSLAGVIVVATLDGALALTGRSLTRAVVAALLEPSGELRAGNAILNIAFTGGAAVGPAIAGVIVAGFGAQTALLLDAASFYVIAVLLLTAKHLPHAEPEPGGMRKRLRAGFRYIAGRPILRYLLMAQAAAFIFFAAVLPIEVIYAKQTLGAGDSGYGLLLASWGGGMVLGSLIFAAFRRAPLAALLVLSTAAVGAGYLGLAFAPTLALACAASVLGGAGNGVQWVAAVSAVQELTAQAMQARVMSVLESVGTAMPGVGFLVGGLVATSHDPRAVFGVAGFGILVVVVVGTSLIAAAWIRRRTGTGPGALDGAGEVMVELRPRRELIRSESNAPSQPNRVPHRQTDQEVMS